MLLSFWNDFLYQPLFNLLIWIYSTVADHNLGWAIVIMTVLLRIVLLPLTILGEKDKGKNEDVSKELRKLAKDFHHDPVLHKEMVRKMMRRKKVHPWAKILSLAIQLLVLILLYQVFLRGITGDKILKILYPFMDFPGTINTIFLGFDLGERYDIVWPGAVAVFLLVEIYQEFRHGGGAQKKDLVYFLLFPTFVFFLLYVLPVAKSLFVLTSMVFSAILTLCIKVLASPAAPADGGHGHH